MGRGGGGGREKTHTEASNWERMVELIHMAFGEGRLAEESMWQAVVLIPKGGKDYRGILLMKEIWKVVTEILNCRLTSSITFQGLLHIFREGHGTGTASLEAKLLHQLAALR